jgi:hypothetical protein
VAQPATPNRSADIPVRPSEAEAPKSGQECPRSDQIKGNQKPTTQNPMPPRPPSHFFEFYAFFVVKKTLTTKNA